jgi:hypothetical protein
VYLPKVISGRGRGSTLDYVVPEKESAVSKSGHGTDVKSGRNLISVLDDFGGWAVLHRSIPFYT